MSMALGSFRRLTVLTLVAALGAIPACKKGGKSSKTPGTSEEDVERQIADAKKAAKANALIDFANKDLTSGRYMSAAKRAEEALASNPQNADAHAILGAARWRAGDAVASTEAYEKAVELEPTNFGAVLGLGRNLQAFGKHKEAAELQETLLKEDAKQVDPLLTQLWSYYALADAEASVRVLDQVFKLLPAEDPQLPLIQATAAFIRPFIGKGPLCQVEGASGSSDLGVDLKLGMKYTGGVVGGEFSRVILFEVREESVIDDALAKKLKLPELGRYKPFGQEEELPIVLIPEIAFGELKLKNVPAVVQSLEPYEAAMGERPGIMLGRQALQAFGAITMDFPARSVTFSKDALAAAPEGAAEVPLLMVTMHIQHAPAIPISIDGADHEFYVYFGGIYVSGAVVTQKHYFKSGHLPREVTPLDDPDTGRKMVYVRELGLGETKLAGTGGLVLVNDPGDANLGSFIQNTAFELGGYLDMALIETWQVTYSFPEGKVYIKPPVAPAAAPADPS